MTDPWDEGKKQVEDGRSNDYNAPRPGERAGDWARRSAGIGQAKREQEERERNR